MVVSGISRIERTVRKESKMKSTKGVFESNGSPPDLLQITPSVDRRKTEECGRITAEKVRGISMRMQNKKKIPSLLLKIIGTE